MKNPNPQGKGLAPVLQNLNRFSHQLDVPPKDIKTVSSELFTSLFILESAFSFEPVKFKTYYLYIEDGEKNHKSKGNQNENKTAMVTPYLRISPISPKEWGIHKQGREVGSCRMEYDFTWTINITPGIENNKHFKKLIKNKEKKFLKNIQSAEKTGDVLPYYLSRISFYKRTLAFALARSLEISMKKKGIFHLSYQQAKRLLSAN